MFLLILATSDFIVLDIDSFVCFLWRIDLIVFVRHLGSSWVGLTREFGLMYLENENKITCCWCRERNGGGDLSFIVVLLDLINLTTKVMWRKKVIWCMLNLWLFYSYPESWCAGAGTKQFFFLEYFICFISNEWWVLRFLYEYHAEWILHGTNLTILWNCLG